MTAAKTVFKVLPARDRMRNRLNEIQIRSADAISEIEIQSLEERSPIDPYSKVVVCQHHYSEHFVNENADYIMLSDSFYQRSQYVTYCRDKI